MEFPTTQWTLLAQATLNGETSSTKALADFCRRYRGPVVAFLRHRGLPSADAEDLAHDFMIHVMEKSTLRRADAARGRFRSYLIGSLVRFLRDTQIHRTRQKHGGRLPPLSLDDPELAVPPPLSQGDANVFDREWALRLLQLALDSLREDYVEAGRQDAYDILRAYLPGSLSTPPYEESAGRLGLSLPAFKTEVHRLRKLFRERLQREVTMTLNRPEDSETEFAYLGRVLRTTAE